MQKKRYVLVGASSRALGMFAKPLGNKTGEKSDDKGLSEGMKESMKQAAIKGSSLTNYAEIVGVFDKNPLRIEVLKKEAGLDCPSYTDCDKMLAELKPDCGIVTTVDRFHHEYIIKLFEAGIDAVTEKPMTIDEEKCLAVMEAEKKTGRKVTVTFNYRYAPYATKIKELIKSGVIGDVLNVDFEYLLDTRHGADYFRRWHRNKANSGGLLVHKSTHHFDLINWWIDEEPVEVMAFGSTRFYGPTRKERGERCFTCQYAKTCEFFMDINQGLLKELYLDCESADGYFRDRCVFADDIDIEDSMSVNVKYSKGAFLSYSLIAHCPYEGWKMSVNGTKGRLEAAEYHSGDRKDEPAYVVDIFDRDKNRTTISVPKSKGGHGGGDEKILDDVFIGNRPDPMGHRAGSFAGAVSILTGIAANKSIKEGRNIKINDLVPLDKFRK